MNKRKRNALAKILVIISAILLILTGAITLVRGRLHYANYWGGAVFAPIAIIIGIFLLILAIFKWEKLKKKVGK